MSKLTLLWMQIEERDKWKDPWYSQDALLHPQTTFQVCNQICKILDWPSQSSMDDFPIYGKTVILLLRGCWDYQRLSLICPLGLVCWGRWYEQTLFVQGIIQKLPEQLPFLKYIHLFSLSLSPPKSRPYNPEISLME